MTDRLPWRWAAPLIIGASCALWRLIFWVFW